jgi:hypothetical protein
MQHLFVLTAVTSDPCRTWLTSTFFYTCKVIVGYLLAGSLIGPGGLKFISELVQVCCFEGSTVIFGKQVVVHFQSA